MPPLPTLSPPLDGRFRLEGVLGSGAQARVVGAVEIASGCRVALKLLYRGAGPAERGRLLREARALASLVHPHLVRFLDYFPDHDPPVLSMERVEGRPLDEVLEMEGNLSRARAAAVGRDLASALASLHAKGILHRDVKPANVLMVPERGPVLVDLGLALSEEDLRHTVSGEAVGTPAYLAPEVLARQAAGPAADLYALGVLLHEAMFRETPYTLADLMAAAQGRPLPPGPRERLGGALGRTVAACLEGDPGARPEAGRVERALSEAVTSARPAGKPGKAPGYSHRRPSRAGQALALVGFAMLGAWGSRAPSPVPSLRVATTPFEAVIGWDGAEGGADLELRSGEAVLLVLAPGDGVRRARIPLLEAREVQVTRGDRLVDFGSPPRRSLKLAPGAPPEADRVRYALDDEGLGIRVDPGEGEWIPDGLRIRQGSKVRECGPRRALPDGGYVFPILEPLRGEIPVSLHPVVRLEGGAVRPWREESWLELDLAPRAWRALASEGSGAAPMLKPVTPPQAPPEDEPSGPHAYRTVSVHAPGLARASPGGEDRWWTPSGNPAALIGFVWGDGLATNPGMGSAGGTGATSGASPGLEPPRIVALPPETAVAPDSGLLPLGRSLGFRFTTEPARALAAERWLVVDDSLATRVEELAAPGFAPLGGPYPTGDGRAWFLAGDGAIRETDAEGRLGPPGGRAPWSERFSLRRGVPAPGERLLALAGSFGEPGIPGFLVMDRTLPRLLGRVVGLPALPVAHPLCLEEDGGAVGFRLVMGRELWRVDATALGKGEVPWTLEWSALVAAGAATSESLARYPDEKARPENPRSNPAVSGGFGVLAFLDREDPPEGAPQRTVAGTPVTYHRWRCRTLATGGGGVADLDTAAFPVFGPGNHTASADLDAAAGIGVVLSDGAAERWSLSLVSLRTGAKLVEWALRPSLRILAPVLVPGAVLVATWPQRLVAYPVPSGGQRPRFMPRPGSEAGRAGSPANRTEAEDRPNR